MLVKYLLWNNFCIIKNTYYHAGVIICNFKGKLVILYKTKFSYMVLFLQCPLSKTLANLNKSCGEHSEILSLNRFDILRNDALSSKIRYHCTCNFDHLNVYIATKGI